MSGLEIAGLVLGALPVLVAVIKQCKTTNGIIFKRRAYIDRLSNALLLHKVTLGELLLMLLRESGCDTSALDISSDQHLQDPDLQSQLLEFLGEEIFKALGDALAQSCDTIGSIVRGINGLIPKSKKDTDDLFELKRLNNDATSRVSDLKFSIKLMLKGDEIKAAISDLDSVTGNLDRLARLVTTNRQSAVRVVKPRATRLTSGFRRIQSLTGDLHTAIDKAWRGSCHKAHIAQVFLDDMVEKASQISRKRPGQHSSSLPCFQLVFITTSTEGRVVGYETTVQTVRVESESSPEGFVSPTGSTVPNVVVTSSESSDLPNRDSTTTSISNLCATISSARSGKPHFAFVLNDIPQMATVSSKKNCLVPYTSDKVMTLKSLLDHRREGLQRTRIPLKFRMLLALRAASSLLQYSHTAWIKAGWSKDIIHFPSRSNNDGNLRFIDFGRPFLSATFGSKSSVTEGPHSSSPAPRDVILELGILLLEIWHEQTMEERFALSSPPQTHLKRFQLATEWMEDVEDPILELYERALGYCMSAFTNVQIRNTTWDDNQIWEGLCTEVIEPLSKNCKQWK